MVTFYYRKGCKACQSLRSALENLAIKNRVVELEKVAPLPDELPADADLPAMVDDGEIYAGSTAVADHLDDLKVFKEWWYKFQSDACYCIEDEDGGVNPPVLGSGDK